MIEPSDTERASWPDATREYVEMLESADDAARQIIATERGEVMKLRKEVERLKDQAARMNWERPTIEQMQAQVAAAYDDAAAQCADQFAAHMTAAICGEPDNSRSREASANMAERLLYRIRGLTPADATAALDALLHQARIEGARMMRDEAAARCDTYQDTWGGPWGEDKNLRASMEGAKECGDAIRAIDPEQMVKRDD